MCKVCSNLHGMHSLKKHVSLNTAGMFLLFTAHPPWQHLANKSAVIIYTLKKNLAYVQVSAVKMKTGAVAVLLSIQIVLNYR